MSELKTFCFFLARNNQPVGIVASVFQLQLSSNSQFVMFNQFDNYNFLVVERTLLHSL